MEIIDWVKEEESGCWSKPNLCAYSLIEAMSEKAGVDVDKVFAPFNPKALEVEFKVNGVEVSFKHCMELIQNAIKDLEAEIRQNLKDEMIEQIYNDMINKKDWK